MALKVLYISDSLGTPIHPRGIFNYSISFVEMLKSLGAEVTLVTERAPGYGFKESFSPEFKKLGESAISGAKTAEVYRYFSSDHFSFQWRYQLPWFRFLAEHAPPVARLIQRIEELATKHHHQEVIKNDYRFMDYIPEKAAHLTKIDNFVCVDRFYYSQILRAYNGMDPIEINAAGYDIAVIDTPTYVRIAGLDSSRVFAILHDLIPLRDSAMGAEWRRLFAKKLEAIFALNPHMIFVSEHTQKTFSQQFPDFKSRSETVVHPTIRQELTAAAARSKGRGATLVASALAAGTKSDDPINMPDGAAAPVLAESQAALPYFATALSDEPRKNLSIIIRAFRQLAGKANMAVIGKIDLSNYFETLADRPPNICFMGYLTENEKTDIIRDSAGVIFASLSEGFGIPIVEGAVLGVPVICSDIAVFREIAGHAATYFDPHDADSLIASVEGALADRHTQQRRATELQITSLRRFSQHAMSQRIVQAFSNAGVSFPFHPKPAETDHMQASSAS